MNIKDYISSGVLELYVLDLLSKAERRAVQQIVNENAEVAEELKQIELALEGYANLYGNKPSEQVKTNLMNKLEFNEPDKLDPKSKVIFLRWIAAAASVLLIISLGLNFYQINKINKVEDSLAKLKSKQFNLEEENSTIKSQNNQFENSLALAEERINLFQNPEIKTVFIKGSELSPNSYAYVNYNKQTKAVTLNGIDLPANGPKNQYQLWALVDGNPVDLGVFDSTDSLVKLTNTVENPDAFAVTLQDRGGNKAPNLELLYLIGNV